MAEEMRRFEGKGAQLVEERQTEKNIINVIALGAFIIEMLLGKAAVAFGDFLISKVINQDKKVLWSFKDEQFGGFAHLYWCEKLSEYFITLVRRGSDEIVKLIALADLPNMHLAEVDGKKSLVGGRSALDLLSAKKILAKENGVKYFLSDNELKLEAYLKNQRQVEAKKRKLDEQIEFEKKAVQRKERIDAMLAQPKVSAWRADNGQGLSGIPVSNEEEWKALPDGTRVIRLEDGLPVEAFIVSKTVGGRCKKANRLDVVAECPVIEKESTAEVVFSAKEMKLFVLDGVPVEVAVVTAEQKKMLKNLNNDTLLAVIEGSGYKIYKMMGEKGNETLPGLYQPL